MEDVDVIDSIVTHEEGDVIQSTLHSGGYEKELYKKWFKAAGQAGFLSISPWNSAGKFTIDIGKVDPNGSAVLSNTKCYIDWVKLAAYLNSIVTGTAGTFYPSNNDAPSPESLVVYGGKTNPAVARVFKSHYWGATKDSKPSYDFSSAFVWKCGEFEGKVTDTGAITPIYDKPISANMIKVTRQEINEIAYRVNLYLSGYAAKFNNWYDV